MSIKAKKVEKERAAAFDRGLFIGASDNDVARTSRRSYYYKEERERVASRSSSSSSRSSSRSSAASPAQMGSSTLNAKAADSDGEEVSDDEDVVRRARAATQALLGGTRPASAQARTGSSPAAATALPNDRLEAYLRGRASSVPTVPLTAPSVAQESARLLHAHCAPSGAAPSVDAEGRVHRMTPEKSSVEKSSLTKASSSADIAVSGKSDPLVFQAAMQMHTPSPDFQQLMALLEQDVRQERHREQQQQQQRLSEKDRASPSVDSAVTAVDPPTDADGRATTILTKNAHPTLSTPRTFAALESTALERLFEDWCHQGSSAAAASGASNIEEGSEADDVGGEVFIAADHRAAAFTLAAVSARDLDSSSWGRRSGQGGASAAPAALASRPSPSSSSAAAITNAPLTWEELMQDEVARRNARSSFNAIGGGGGDGGGGRVLSTPSGVAEQATQQLRRFLQSVACLERLVGNRRFMRSVAAYLYEHHKVFLPHYNRTSSPSPSPLLSTTTTAAAAASSSAIVEHHHDEYTVYEEFGRRVSSALLSLLTDNVDGFNEAEFVEALYDTPAAFADGSTPGELAVKGPQNVLSFPAWRLVLAMSDFGSFFAWMMDYISEEYHLDGLEEESTRVAVAGTRGLRALIRSTYQRPVNDTAEDASASVSDGVAIEPAAVATNSASAASLQMSSSSPMGSTFARSPPRSAEQPSLELPRSALAPLAAGTPLQPAPPPTGSSLSSSANNIAVGVHLRQFFPSPPASAEGSARVGTTKTSAVYRKRQTTHPGRNLPPITPATDSMVRPSSADGQEASGAPLTGVAQLSASLPPSLRMSGAGDDAAVSVPAHRPTRTRSSADKGGSASVSESNASRRGSKTPKPKLRVPSNTRATAGDTSKVKPLKPRLNR